jgi:hypothetical protein
MHCLGAVMLALLGHKERALGMARTALPCKLLPEVVLVE